MEREAFQAVWRRTFIALLALAALAVRTILAPQFPGLSKAYCGEIVAGEERSGRCPVADKFPTASPVRIQGSVLAKGFDQPRWLGVPLATPLSWCERGRLLGRVDTELGKNFANHAIPTRGSAQVGPPAPVSTPFLKKL